MGGGLGTKGGSPSVQKEMSSFHLLLALGGILCEGAVPLPAKATSGKKSLALTPTFAIRPAAPASPVLTSACRRFDSVIFVHGGRDSGTRDTVAMQLFSLAVIVSSPARSSAPQAGDDEAELHATYCVAKCNTGCSDIAGCSAWPADLLTAVPLRLLSRSGGHRQVALAYRGYATLQLPRPHARHSTALLSPPCHPPTARCDGNREDECIPLAHRRFNCFPACGPWNQPERRGVWAESAVLAC